MENKPTAEMSEASKFVFYRTYSRWMPEKGRRETWEETVDRYFSFFQPRFESKVPPKVWKKLKENFLTMNVVPSMRAVWAAGPALAANELTAYNCCCHVIKDIRSFSENFYILMCGVGVGFSVENEFISQLPIVKKYTGDHLGVHVVGDSRESWAEAFRIGLEAWFGGQDITFDYSKVRPKGARLKTIGGRASGPDPLKKLLDFTRETVMKAAGRKLNSLECLDILNMTGEVTEVGGVRRAAEISFGDLNDDLHRNAKVHPFPDYRWQSNNTAVYKQKPSELEFMKEWASLAASGTGERGIFNLEAMVNSNPRRIKALKAAGYEDKINTMRTNPCVHGSTMILTDKGNVPIRNVCDQKVNVWNGYEFSEVTPQVTGYNQPMILVGFSNGSKLICTENHNFVDSNGQLFNWKDDNNFVGRTLLETDFPVIEKRKINSLISSLTAVPFSNTKQSNYLDGVFVFCTNINFAASLQLYLAELGVKSSRSGYFDSHLHKYIEYPYSISTETSYRVNINAENYQKLVSLGFTLGIENPASIVSNGLSFSRQPLKITSVTYFGVEEKVYCFKEPKRGYGTFNGIVTGQCGEIGLIAGLGEFCNLSEVIVRSTDTFDELMDKVRSAVWFGAIQSCLTDFPYIRSSFKEICEIERLLGVSLTGQMDAPHLMTPEKLQILKEEAIKTAKKASKALGINLSSAITTGKPSGCQKSDTLLITSNGLLTLGEIGDTNGSSWQNHSIFIAQEKAAQESTKFFVNGKAKTKKISLAGGIELESTLNHQYRVLDKEHGYVWKQAADIQVGDCIPYRLGGYETGGSYQPLKTVTKERKITREIRQPEKLNEDIAWLMGLFVGDGSVHSKGIRIALNTNEMKTVEKACEILEKEFAIKAKTYIIKGELKLDIYANSTMFLDWLKTNGLLKGYCESVEIPKIIRMSPKSVIESYVDGYFCADGCEDERGRKILVTVSKKMAEQLTIVLRALGHYATCRNMPPTKTSLGERMRYRITTNKGRNGKKIGSGHAWAVHKLDSLGLETLYPDFVESIEDSECNTFDIEVPNNNCYIANSVVSHNTVSQLTNSSSGAHPRYDNYYIRRYRIAGTDPLFKMMRDQGVIFSPENGQRPKDVETNRAKYAKQLKDQNWDQDHIEAEVKRAYPDWSEDQVTKWVVSFPEKAPDGCITRESVSAIDQLEWYLKLKNNWCEHNQSITVYVRDGEWIEVGAWVYKHFDELSGVSFLPYDAGKYEQTPYESISKETYEKMVAEQKTINYDALMIYEQDDNTQGAKTYACTAGGCEVV